MMKQKIQRPNESLGDYGSHLTMFDVSGPAVRLLWIATAIQWPFMIMFPFIAFQFTDCNGLGLPAYRMWLWSLVFPIFAAMMIIEWRCFLAAIRPKAERCTEILPKMSKVALVVSHFFQLQCFHVFPYVFPLFVLNICRNITAVSFHWDLTYLFAPIQNFEVSHTR